MTRNTLLDSLDENDAATLAPHMQEVVVERGQLLAEAGHFAQHVYFPLEGVLAFISTTERGATVEVAAVGRDGVATVNAIFGDRHLPFRVISKFTGRALRVSTEVVARQLQECGALHARLLDAANDVIAQISQSAICNRYHNAKERLARWVLTTADRAQAFDLPVTHEFISSMVGGPRSAITEASAELRASGAIDYSRGLLSIKDADQLRRECCECYAASVR